MRAAIACAAISTLGIKSAPSRAAAPGGAESAAAAAAVQQSTVDSAMARMRERQEQRQANPSNAEKPSAKAAAPNVVNVDFAGDPYGRDAMTVRKLELIKHYEADLGRARAALRRHEIVPADVRDLASEQAALQMLPLDKFRDLMVEADDRNAARIARYRDAFGDLHNAAKTVVTILMKSGMIDTASVLPDDPLSEELELTRGVRRVYYTFVLPGVAHNESSAQPRRHNGYVEFQLAASQGLWLPTWADLDGNPFPLFDAEAFVPLRPYRIFYDGRRFLVAQEPANSTPPPLFSLITPRASGFGWSVNAYDAMPIGRISARR